MSRMDPSLLWVAESFLISVSMILVGLATLVEWDVLLLDQDDLQESGAAAYSPSRSLLGQGRKPAGFRGIAFVASEWFFLRSSSRVSSPPEIAASLMVCG